ncbi:M91 family zinc metallopeptidase [Dyadobacter jejuensis]|uniref:M91 family zinc metallopeptidase n=1 Tax=Dyadobacter jejuensis TaxID=1082580 RepID=UPI001304CE06|nr:M91 family zinc metallopeptidase [Dyadobacter jejuensis]
MNLPKTVAIGSKTFTYDYDAGGTKHKYAGDTITAKYAGFFEYDASNVLKRIATSEGQLVPSGDTLRFDYYLKDHLGNVRLVFSEKGDILQSTDYYPFGLEMDRNSPVVGLNSRNGVNRYLFQGQEKMPEFNSYDFGNRLFDPATVHWNRPDRYADKYYNLSPYSAFGGNPLRYTDMNGDSLVVNYFDSNSQTQRVHYGYTQQGGYSFYNADGTAYSGGDKFIAQVGGALGRLGLGKEGRQMVDFLSYDAQTVTIGMSTSNKYIDATHSVGFIENSGAQIPTEGAKGGVSTAPSYISLGHELAHAEDHLKGTLNTNTTWNGYLEAEKYSTNRENQFRSENGLPLRTHYGVLRDPNGINMPDNSTRIIDSKGNSLFFKPINYRKR